MPMFRRTATGSMFEAQMSCPSKVIVPVCWNPGIRSFMRLKQRMYVLLPQPEGPMMAVTRFL
jgi:hypothetical protein